MFVDEAQITVKAGDGGKGAVSFRREAKIPKGGPDGGDGGRGGDVVFFGDVNINTLLDFSGKPNWKAGNGEAGRSKQQYGLAGEDLVIKVPPGTLVYNKETGELIADIGPGDRRIIAKGGKGGFGNDHYKSPTNQAPKKAGPGEPGERVELRMELKLIADVGIVGLPNAGKSTLLSVISDARPKIADYPFTTLTPQLGIAELDPKRRLVFADIPGLIEGAAGGAGLGHEFLRHIERTKVLVHLVDIAPIDGSRPEDNYRLIRNELAGYSPELAEKREVIALNKVDLLDEEEAAAAVKSFARELGLGHAEPVMVLSAATRGGTRELLERLWTMVRPKVENWDAPAPVVEKQVRSKPGVSR
jgi:GTP-binding protein